MLKTVRAKAVALAKKHGKRVELRDATGELLEGVYPSGNSGL
jgi:hypothetical protein